ncbi:MAG: hypothetical protein HQK78_03205 [Desulfobacterales bacterium]|nr:hypothetical protein [Desulfobacterales bacterium]
MHDLIKKNGIEITEVVTIKKKIVLPTKADEEAKVAKYNSLVAYNRLKDVIKKHSEYIDIKGNKSSGAKGLMLQINRRVKDKIGHSIQELYEAGKIESLNAMVRKISDIITIGEEQNKLRAEIKKQIYSFIDKYCEVMEIGKLRVKAEGNGY